MNKAIFVLLSKWYMNCYKNLPVGQVISVKIASYESLCYTMPTKLLRMSSQIMTTEMFGSKKVC